MPMLNVNTNDAITMTAVPAGNYKLRITKAETTSTKSGGVRLAIVYKIVSPDKVKTPAGDVEVLDRQIFDGFNLSIFKEGALDDLASRKALGFLKEFVELIGVAPDEAGDLNSDNFINKEVWAVIGIEEYEGRDQNRVKKYFQSDRAEASTRSR